MFDPCWSTSPYYITCASPGLQSPEPDPLFLIPLIDGGQQSKGGRCRSMRIFERRTPCWKFKRSNSTWRLAWELAWPSEGHLTASNRVNIYQDAFLRNCRRFWSQTQRSFPVKSTPNLKTRGCKISFAESLKETLISTKFLVQEKKPEKCRPMN